MTQTEPHTHQHEVIAVIDELATAMHELFPQVDHAKMARFGSAIANMFDQIWQTQVRNMLPFIAQGETNRVDIETLRGQMSDVRTVQNDLMGSRSEFEERLTIDEQRLVTIEGRIAAIEERLDTDEQRIAKVERAVRAPEDMTE